LFRKRIIAIKFGRLDQGAGLIAEKNRKKFSGMVQLDSNAKAFWLMYMAFVLSNAIFIDTYYIFYDGLKESQYWLHGIALGTAKEYDPLWAEGGKAMKVAVFLSLFVTVWFAFSVGPTLIVDSSFGNYKSTTKLVSYLYCAGSAISTILVFALEFKEYCANSDLAPSFSMWTWFTFSLQIVVVKCLWDHLKTGDKAEQKLEKISRKKSGGFKKFAKSKLNDFTASKRFKDKVRHIFDSVDIDKSGSVDVSEVYSMVLLIYLFVAQYTVVNAKTIPTIEEVKELYDKMDKDGNGTLDYDEFEALAVLEVEAVSARISTQLACQLAASPFLATCLVSFVCQYVLVGSFHALLVGNLHRALLDYVFTRTIAITILTCVLNMTVMPFLLHLIDLIWYESVRSKETRLKLEKKSLFGKFLEAVIHYFN
jgi:hypothetical protein